jgi:hypothetical protein
MNDVRAVLDAVRSRQAVLAFFRRLPDESAVRGDVSGECVAPVRGTPKI